MTPWAAKCKACCEDPHCRSTVVAGTDSGKPAVSTAVRPMLAAWSPTWPTHPAITSSTSAGSSPVRSTRAASVALSRCTGCTPDKAPPGLPRPDAVLTMSTMTAEPTATSSPTPATPTATPLPGFSHCAVGAHLIQCLHPLSDVRSADLDEEWVRQ